MCRPGSDPENIQVHTPPFTRKYKRFEELDEPEELYGTWPGEPEEEFEEANKELINARRDGTRFDQT